MTRIESQKVSLKQAPEEVFRFLSDFNNIGKLMPDQVEGFSVDGDTCKFTIKGMATLGLKYESKTPNSEVVMTKHEKAPFDLKLICKITEAGADHTDLQLFFDADLNPFLKMMAEKPLGNFLNLLVNKYKDLNQA
ncbi:MAG: SRPBCC family protein [Bacteroidia bacterium]|nr:SRPBCC family protein [Bacteroidia bacterium]